MTDERVLPVALPSTKPNWLRAGVKVIPYVGDALDELLYGRLEEARWNRLEYTLEALGSMMKERQIPPEEIKKEEFGRLLEGVAPHIARATNEIKTTMFRDLLLNAVTLAPADVQWESARLAGDILSDLDYAALEILAALSKLGARDGGPKVDVIIPPEGIPAVELRENRDRRICLSYNRFVVDRGYKQLTDSSARLVILGGHGLDRYEHVTLTPLGEFVIDWCTTKDGEPALQSRAPAPEPPSR
jgi:hypothetical protein